MRPILTERRHLWRKSVAPLLGAAAFLTAAPALAAEPIDINPETYCQWPEDQRVSLLATEIRSAWSDLDVNGRFIIGRMNPHDANFGSSPLSERHPMRKRIERYKTQLQEMMVRTGILFPHYNRPMDGDRLIDRFASGSVPAYNSAPEHQIAVMEAYLAADSENRALGIAFIAALHALDGSALALSSGKTAPEFHAQNRALENAFDAFMPALKAALFSTDFEIALGRRLMPYCADVLAERNSAADLEEDAES